MSSPQGYGRPSGDGWYGPDPQPWDPAYPHPATVLPGQGYGYPPPAPPAPPVRPQRSRGLVGAVVVLSLALVAALVLLVTGVTRTVNGTAVAASGGSSTGTSGGSGNTTTPGGSSGGSSTSPSPGNGNGGFPFPSSGAGSASSGKATTAQQVGVVDIYTVQKYNSAAAAGTGIVLTSSGDILTNNHVIDGATSIKVRIVSTGKTYVAKVVGTSPTKDVAVVRLVNASGLTTANFGDSDTVKLADKVTGVGNAGGTGGVPSSATGKVTALHRTITASDETGTNSERLHNVIVTDAPIQSGDSGGPLYSADGHIVGMDTAASTSGQKVGFAIPINDALAVAAQIEKGIETSSIHIGYPGFLGVSVSPSSASGALIAGVLRGGPAAGAGISGGDVITKVDSTAISNSKQLRTAVSAHNPGTRVSVSYTDPSTGSHRVSITLATGPAD